MTIRSGIAAGVSGVLTWILRNVARRSAGALPGKVALKIDPAIVAELRGKMRDGSVVVVGTNGKTTVTNLLADVVLKSGRTVLCNRTGANLKGGIATALLQGKSSDWGVIECDELWLAKVLPDLQADWVLLLNLFRDQLDRCGEIDRIQESIVGALASSPKTGLIFNADDPLCAFVAKRAAEERAASGHDLRTISFGLGKSMGLAQNIVSDATMCQVCSHMFAYEYRQYGQLGFYNCPECGFSRPPLDFEAGDIELTPEGVALAIETKKPNEGVLGESLADKGKAHLSKLSAPFPGAYNVYNLLAVYSCATSIGCSEDDVQSAVDSFNPKNGRLQRYVVNGRKVLLNLAKNPTGFNQNLRIVSGDKNPHAVAFFINDQVVDGHDISWIWDIDFEELVASPDVIVFAGGERKNDLQLRLKYAGIDATLINGIEDVFEALSTDDDFPREASVYAIANYSALPPVHHALDMLGETR